MTINRSSVWAIFLSGGLLGLLLFALRLGAAAESAVLVAYSGAATAAMFAGLYLNRPKPQPGWFLVALGQAFNLLGDIALTRSLYLKDPAVPPAVFEWFYLVGQACFLIGLFHIFIWSRRLINRNALMQGAMVAIGLSTLIWVWVVSPNLRNGFGLIEWAQVLAYPACLLIIISILSIYLMTGLGKGWGYRLLYAATFFYAIGLSYYNHITANTGLDFALWSYPLPYIYDAAYATAYLLVGSAFLHPSMRNFEAGLAEKGATVSRAELFLLGTAFWIGPIAYVFIEPARIDIDKIVIMASMLIIFTLNEWRLARLVRILEEQNNELSQHRETLHYQAFHDSLTGLPNRAALYNHIEELIVDTRVKGARGGVFLIDVNNFKQVNDTLGHDEGDRVLKEVSNAFTALKRKEDLVGRWGGDEFMMVLRNLPDDMSAKSLARRLHQEIRWTVSGTDGSVDVSISIGICLIPTGAEKLQTVVKKADIALYQAKRMPEFGISLSGW